MAEGGIAAGVIIAVILIVVVPLYYAVQVVREKVRANSRFRRVTLPCTCSCHVTPCPERCNAAGGYCRGTAWEVRRRENTGVSLLDPLHRVPQVVRA